MWIALFLLLAVLHTELPELLSLSDNTSNDFHLNASGSHAASKCTISELAGTTGDGSPVRSIRDFHAPSIEMSSMLIEHDLLLLCSVHRT